MAEAMEGRLGTDDERELALHLVGCDECKGIYEGLQQAHPALTSIELGYPSTESLDAAVHRATTVLRGEADPGPHGLSEEPPRLPEEPDAHTVRIDSGGTHTDEGLHHPGRAVDVDRADDAGPAAPPPAPTVRAEPPRTPPVIAMDVPEAHVRPILPDAPPETDEPEPDGRRRSTIELPPPSPPRR